MKISAVISIKKELSSSVVFHSAKPRAAVCDRVPHRAGRMPQQSAAITVLNAIVHHLHVVTSATRANVSNTDRPTWAAILLRSVLNTHKSLSYLLASGWAIHPFFTPTDTHTDKPQPSWLKSAGATCGIVIQQLPPSIMMSHPGGFKLINHRIYRHPLSP